MCVYYNIIYICCIIKSWYSMPAVVPKQQFTTDWKIWQDTFHECRWRDNHHLRLCFPSKTPPVLPFRPSYGCLKIPSLFTPCLYNYGPWRFPKMGVPPKSSKSFDHFSLEAHGDLGIPHFKKHQNIQGFSQAAIRSWPCSQELGDLQDCAERGWGQYPYWTSLNIVHHH